MDSSAGRPITSITPPAEAERAIEVFDVPAQPDYRGEAGIVSIGLVELTMEEESRAARRSGADPAALAVELLKEGLVEVNGKRVSVADGSTDIELARFPAKLRQLAMTAFAEINTPKNEEVKSFLKSRKRKV